VSRVPRKALRDYLARLFGKRVYGCGACGRRFHDRPTSRPTSFLRRRLSVLTSPAADLDWGTVGDALQRLRELTAVL
jgi:hypothetical protein